MVDVIWGERQTHLTFDRYPYPEGIDPRELCAYEGEIINAAEHFLEPGDVAIDIGACIGFHTCLLAKLVGPEGLVYGFEPHQKSFDILRNHVFEANACGNVALLRAMMLDKHIPAVTLWSPPEIGYASIHKYANAYESEVAPAYPLDAVISEEHHPRFIKIDVEGSELAVLRGAKEILARGVDCVIVEFNYHILHLCDQSDMEIRRLMADLGYDMFIINIADMNRRGSFVNPILVELNVPITLKGGHHINVMFSTREKVTERWTI